MLQRFTNILSRVFCRNTRIRASLPAPFDTRKLTIDQGFYRDDGTYAHIDKHTGKEYFSPYPASHPNPFPRRFTVQGEHGFQVQTGYHR